MTKQEKQSHADGKYFAVYLGESCYDLQGFTYDTTTDTVANTL